MDRRPARKPSRTALPGRLQSFLLRVHEERVEHVVLRYELIDLASGRCRQFASLAALQRHLRAATPEAEGPPTPG